MLSLESLSEPFPFQKICGLRPEIWVSVGVGFAREDIKALILSQGRGFVGEAVTTLQEICLRIIRIPSDSILSSSSRQEILRMLVNEPRIFGNLTEMKKVKRQKHFVKKLDHAFQSGRMTFAHPEEEEVYDERLEQALGKSAIRNELRALGQAYEAWLEASSLVDPPMLIRKAIQVLREGWPQHLSCPQEIWNLSVQSPESLEKEFWDVIQGFVQVRLIQSLQKMNLSSAIPFNFELQKWHTLDDAAEYLSDQLLEQEADSQWQDYAVLIPDIPGVRRSLRRAFEDRKIPLADPRDPTRLRWDENVKWALLPLEVVARNYERSKVISWLRAFHLEKEFSEWVIEINQRGIRSGIQSYFGGNLEPVHSWLIKLASQLGGKKDCSELIDCYLNLLREEVIPFPDRHWLIPFFEQMGKVFVADMERVGLSKKKAPILFWVERLQNRLAEASPPIEKLKPSLGVRLYRLQQAPVQPVKKLWIFGLPPHWLGGEGTGSYWFTEREREILSSEFAVRSCVQIRDERLEILKSWALASVEVAILDPHYDTHGRERESILPILRELEVKLGGETNFTISEKGSHPRFAKSFQAIRPIQPQKVQLPSLLRSQNKVEITATAIERFSRCSFQALAYHRWKLKDIREPETDLWPDIRGNLLHEAVRLLVRSLNSTQNFEMSPRDAIEHAWRSKRLRGLIRSPKIDQYIKNKLCNILESFCTKEKEYLSRSGVKPMCLEDLTLRLDESDYFIVGQPDRIDQHADGLFIIDYKSSGNLPHGSEMINSGYRLQLPFYAIAARKTLKQPILGVQFVELNRKASRKSGIFFKEYNGRQQGMLTQVQGRSKSLIDSEPEEIWENLEQKIAETAKQYLKGYFEATPKSSFPEKECHTCLISDLCGKKRVVEMNDSEEGES